MGDGSLPCALVTGGSAGIGLAICHRLLDDGYEVISLARRRSPLDHPKLHSVEVDLMDRAATTAAAHDIARRFEVTTLVHNAGVIRPALISDVKLEDLDAVQLRMIDLGPAARQRHDLVALREQVLADGTADAGAAAGDCCDPARHAAAPISASTRSGLPLPFSILSGGQISTAPAGGSRSRLLRHCRP